MLVELDGAVEWPLEVTMDSVLLELRDGAMLEELLSTVERLLELTVDMVLLKLLVAALEWLFEVLVAEDVLR